MLRWNCWSLAELEQRQTAQQWQRGVLRCIYWHQLVGLGSPCVLLTIPTPKKALELELEAGKYTCKHHTEFVTEALQQLISLQYSSDFIKVESAVCCQKSSPYHDLTPSQSDGSPVRYNEGVFYLTFDLILPIIAVISSCSQWVFITLSDYWGPVSQTKTKATTCSNSSLHWIVILDRDLSLRNSRQ